MSEDRDEQEERGFKVEDRRRFAPSGEPRRTEGSEPEEAAGEEADTGDSDKSGPAAVGFSGFVVGLAQQAFMLLGASPDPASGVVHKDLDQAAAMIDIIAMLQEKTAGNLSQDEARLVEEVLYELRLRYVAETRGGSPEPGDR